jgi:hypothetical protein
VKERHVLPFSASTPISDRLNSSTSPDRQLLSLERRLEDGYRRIESAREAGQDITAWEEFWIQLLHQYESVADDLALAA